MHSNETICKKNPVEQSMCAQSAFSIRNRPQKEKSFLYISLLSRPHGAFFAKSKKTQVIPKMLYVNDMD